MAILGGCASVRFSWRKWGSRDQDLGYIPALHCSDFSTPWRLSRNKQLPYAPVPSSHPPWGTVSSQTGKQSKAHPSLFPVRNVRNVFTAWRNLEMKAPGCSPQCGIQVWVKCSTPKWCGECIHHRYFMKRWISGPNWLASSPSPNAHQQFHDACLQYPSRGIT